MHTELALYVGVKDVSSICRENKMMEEGRGVKGTERVKEENILVPKNKRGNEKTMVQSVR